MCTSLSIETTKTVSVKVSASVSKPSRGGLAVVEEEEETNQYHFGINVSRNSSTQAQSQ